MALYPDLPVPARRPARGARRAAPDTRHGRRRCSSLSGSSGSRTTASSSSTSAGCRSRRSTSSAARRPRSPTRSGRWSCAARRRSAIAAAYGIALAAARGEDLDAADARAARRRGRPPSTSPGRSTRCAPTRRAEHARRDPPRRGRALPARWPRTRPALLAPGTRALTHCNAGGLATGGYGSAVGALLAAWERDLLAHVWVDETRPLLQGARLTAWELETARHPARGDRGLGGGVADGGRRGRRVFTGADRIAANGDTANKIGTYSLAVLAAPPRDPALRRRAELDRRPRDRDGAGDPDRGARPGRGHRALRRRATRPSTSRRPTLITAIVTEHGVHRAPYAESLAGAVARVKALILAAGYATRLRPLTDDVREAAAAGRRPADRRLDPRRRSREVDEVDEVHVVTNARYAADFARVGAGHGRRRPRRRHEHERGPARRDRRHPVRDRARRASTTTCS